MKNTPQNTQTICLKALESLKAQNIISLDVANLTSITDYMIIATGTSTAHIRALASQLKTTLKKNHIDINGIEGIENAEWVLCDAGDVVIHIMQESTREYYGLEKIWSVEKCSSA